MTMPTNMTRTALLLACMLAAPASLRGQRAAPGPLLAQQAAPAPLELLLRNQEALGLSAEQVERIQTLRANLARVNEPLVTRMMEYRTRWQRARRPGRPGGALLLEESAQLRQIRQAAEPIHRQIQANNRAAMQEVNHLLTREQRERLRELVQERRPPPGRGGAPQGGADPLGG